jgi:polyisoprenoid-binding protein YceI
MRRLLSILLLAGTLVACTQQTSEPTVEATPVAAMSPAAWVLDNNGSSLYFLSIKVEHVVETHSFTSLSGQADTTSATVEIDLSSVDTAVELRDERMLDVLFEVALFASATVTADLTSLAVTDLSPGESVTTELAFNLDLHGASNDMTAAVQLTQLADGALRIQTTSPVNVNAGDFSLVDGVNKLRELAGLPSVSYAVPVTFNLLFNPA